MSGSSEKPRARRAWALFERNVTPRSATVNAKIAPPASTALFPCSSPPSIERLAVGTSATSAPPVVPAEQPAILARLITEEVVKATAPPASSAAEFEKEQPSESICAVEMAPPFCADGRREGVASEEGFRARLGRWWGPHAFFDMKGMPRADTLFKRAEQGARACPADVLEKCVSVNVAN